LIYALPVNEYVNTAPIPTLQQYFMKNVAKSLVRSFELQTTIEGLTSELSIPEDHYYAVADSLSETLSPHEYGVLADERHLKDFYFTLGIGSILAQVEPTINTDEIMERVAVQLRGVVNYVESVYCDPVLAWKFRELYDQYRQYDDRMPE
jgi:hypothetical protein